MKLFCGHGKGLPVDVRDAESNSALKTGDGKIEVNGKRTAVVGDIWIPFPIAVFFVGTVIRQPTSSHFLIYPLDNIKVRSLFSLSRSTRLQS